MLAVGSATDLKIRIGPPVTIDYSLSLDMLRPEHLSSLVGIIESYMREYPDQWELWKRL
jgi:hypothetical protein